MTEKSPTQNLNRISTNVDKLIAVHGSEHAADLIESIVLKKNSCIDTIDIQKLIITEVCKAFKIKFKLLDTSNSEIYKKARKSCFYLLHIYGKLSYREIKTKFPGFKKHRTYISSYVSDVKAIIELPGIDKDHHKIHVSIEAVIIKFSNKK